MRKIAKLGLALAFSLTSVFAGVSPAMAADDNGGCRHFSSPDNIDLCLSARGNTVYPDFYINSRRAGTCTFSYYLAKPTGSQKVASGSCANNGHYGQYPVVVSSGPGLCYSTFIDIKVGSSTASYNGGGSGTVTDRWCY